uniref:RNA helicase n=1 Tax=Alexandrium catenella TaxID=2925 RepID=A0A7S1RDV7_ALECA
MAPRQQDWTSWSPWYAWTLKRLCRFASESGGWFWASRVEVLFVEDPRHWEVVTKSGGLKAFCEYYPTRLRWTAGRQLGYEQVHLVKQEGGGYAGPREGAAVGSAPEDKKRVPRLAAEFAGGVPDRFEGAYVSKEEFQEAWVSFCEEKGESPGGVGRALFLLVRWHVLSRAGSNGFKIVRRTVANFKKRAPADSEGALEGQRPPLVAGEYASPVGPYWMPQQFSELLSLDVYAMQAAVENLLQESMGLVPKSVEWSNFREYQHALLWTEELQMKYDIAMYDLEEDSRLPYHGGLHEIFVPGLAEKRPSVLRGDKVLLTCKQGRFLGYAHTVLLDKIKVSFHESFQNRPPFTIHFDFNRTPLRVMHRAVDELQSSLMATTGISRSPKLKDDPRLNPEQRAFLTAASGKASGKNEPPLLLWGPPGTGKTTTLVNTVKAILDGQPSAKILVTAPSNSASDHICEMLSGRGVQQSEMLRLVAIMRDHRHFSDVVLNFTRTDSTTGCFKVPELNELQQHRVVVATCTCSAYIRSRMNQLSNCWFSHIFVDEAAQAMEAEAIVPLTLRQKTGRIFLAGDFKQLGPVVRSPAAIRFGLDVPLMERIVQSITTEHSRVFTLLDTYRAHPSILKLYNKTVYADVLRCKSPASSYDMEGWPECPRGEDGSCHPMIFHHCNGQESRSKDSPSWQNVEEGNAVKNYLMRLLAWDVEAKDIGIISPYHQQCQRLRNICLGENVDVEVGTTEVFQGREKRVIIISTVRSRDQEAIAGDIRFTLGFLANYKRTNVALSRARSMLIVVGNMELLSTDATWHNVIKLVKGLGCLRGPAFRLSHPVRGENSEWVGQANQAGPAGGARAGFDGAVDRPWRDNF